MILKCHFRQKHALANSQSTQRSINIFNLPFVNEMPLKRVQGNIYI